ncbi:hypothetical protein DQ04_09141000, partial [Trypanosoma grayi]|uniref:hypothetical protein n=1 Tax=Trypanosoma grayi TaxID=71804 RepID=UPI0004F40BF4
LRLLDSPHSSSSVLLFTASSAPTRSSSHLFCAAPASLAAPPWPSPTAPPRTHIHIAAHTHRQQQTHTGQRQPLCKPSTQHALPQQHRQSGRVGPQLSVPTQRSGSRTTRCHRTGGENTLLEVPHQHHNSHAAHSSEARNIIARTAPPLTQTSLPDATRTDALDAAQHRRRQEQMR